MKISDFDFATARQLAYDCIIYPAFVAPLLFRVVVNKGYQILMAKLIIIYGQDKNNPDHQLRPLNHNNKEVKGVVTKLHKISYC